jgi:hypothetical protein
MLEGEQMKSLAKLLITVATPLMVLPTASSAAELSDADVENLVKRSYQYVTMYNVNNKFALKQGGWNIRDADTELKDHTMSEIAGRTTTPPTSAACWTCARTR